MPAEAVAPRSSPGLVASFIVTSAAAAVLRGELIKGGRLTSDPSRSSLGLLPSGPDPVGEWLVHRQPPGLYIGRTKQRMQAPPCRRRASFPRPIIRHGNTTKWPPSAWSLHPQLERDTANIGDLPLSRVLVINDANYPWLLLVPRRPDIVELIDLDEVAQAQLMTEIARVSRALREVTAMPQAQCRGARQRGAATARPRHRAVPQRRGLAEAGLGRGAAARLRARRAARASSRRCARRSGWTSCESRST